MRGRIKRRLAATGAPDRGPLPAAPGAEVVCPLCDRPIPAALRDAHHLVPKSRGGVQTTFLHRICHRQLHALLTETELARQYATVEALRAHPELARFLAWVRHKPDDFDERTRKSARLRAR